MPARCHKDSCTVHWSEVVEAGRVFQADVQLDGARGLACVDGTGIRVKLANDTVDDVVSCYNALRRTSAGALHASLPDAVRIVRDDGATTGGSNPVPMRGIGTTADGPEDSPSSFSADNFTVTNPFACTAIMVVTAEMQFGWSVNPAGPTVDPSSGPDLTVFNGQFVYNLLLDGEIVCAERVSASGLTDTNGDTGQHKKDYRGLSATRVLAAGEAITFTDAMWNEGPDQRISMITTASQASPVRGFRTSRVRVVILPLTGVTA